MADDDGAGYADVGYSWGQRIEVAVGTLPPGVRAAEAVVAWSCLPVDLGWKARGLELNELDLRMQLLLRLLPLERVAEVVNPRVIQ